jgi:hypothetical protein
MPFHQKAGSTFWIWAKENTEINRQKNAIFFIVIIFGARAKRAPMFTELSLAPIAAASFCDAERSKRYSGKREKAPEKADVAFRQNQKKHPNSG